MQFNPVIIIPANNEEAHIRDTIFAIQSTFLIPNSNIIVIDDGSIDRTAQIAEQQGARVIRIEKNSGKTRAFFLGLRAALQIGGTSILTLDADLNTRNLEEIQKDITALLRKAHEASLRKETKMVVAKVYEEKFPIQESFTSYTSESSGIRAFSNVCAYRLLKSPFKRFPQGFSLELFLDTVLGKYKETYDSRLLFRPAYQGANARVQNKEVVNLQKKIERLKKLAKTREKPQKPHIQRPRLF